MNGELVIEHTRGHMFEGVLVDKHITHRPGDALEAVVLSASPAANN